MSTHSDQPNFPPRKLGFLGWLTFIIALAALTFALLSWLGIFAPEAWQTTVQRQWHRAFAEPLDDENPNVLTLLRKKFVEARDFAEDPETREQASEKLAEAKGMLTEWKETTTPKVKNLLETLAEKTSQTMDSLRSGAKTARDEIQELINKINTIEEEKESEDE